MEDHPHNLSKMQPWLQLKKGSPDYAQWIMVELGKIAILMGEEISLERLSLTTEELLDVDPKDLSKGFRLARKECRFFPRPAEIFAFINREELRIMAHPLRPGCNCEDCVTRRHRRD